MPIFGDQENALRLCPNGDYLFTLIDLETLIEDKGKLRGSELFKVKLRFDIPNLGQMNVFERLYDHPSMSWRMDTFLKCSGIALPKGAGWDFSAAAAQIKKCYWINPYGLRGLARLEKHVYKKQNGDTAENMRVGVFWTDKQKYPRDETVNAPAPSSGPNVDDDDVPF